MGRELIEGNNVLRKIHDIIQNEIDVPHIAAKDRLADAVVGNIILLIGGKDVVGLQVLPLYLFYQVMREDWLLFRIISGATGRCSFFRTFAREVAEKVVSTLAIKTHSTAPQLSAALPPSPYPGTGRRERSF